MKSAWLFVTIAMSGCNPSPDGSTPPTDRRASYLVRSSDRLTFLLGRVGILEEAGAIAAGEKLEWFRFEFDTKLGETAGSLRFDRESQSPEVFVEAQYEGYANVYGGPDPAYFKLEIAAGFPLVNE